jgi:hypothetical protein
MSRTRLVVRAQFVRHGYSDVTTGITFSELKKALEMSDKQLYGGLRNRDGMDYYRHEGGIWYLGTKTPRWWNETLAMAALDEHLAHRSNGNRRPAKPVREEIEDWSRLLKDVAYLKALEQELRALDEEHPVSPSGIGPVLLRHGVLTTSEERLYIGRRLRDTGYIVILTKVGYPVYLTEKYFNSTEADIEAEIKLLLEPEVDLVSAAHHGEATKVDEVPSGSKAFTHGTDFGNWVRVEVNPVLWTTEEKVELAKYVLSIPVS